VRSQGFIEAIKDLNRLCRDEDRLALIAMLNPDEYDAILNRFHLCTHYLYLMQSKATRKCPRLWTKVGISGNEKRRRSEIARDVQKEDVEIHTVFAFCARKFSEQAESIIKYDPVKGLADYRLPSREWFDLPPSKSLLVVVDVVKSVILEHGCNFLTIRSKRGLYGKWNNFDLTRNHWAVH